MSRQEELDAGREHHLGLHFRLDGKRRGTLHCRIKRAYVWQDGCFPDDFAFWQARLSESDSVKPVKAGRAFALTLWTEKDFDAFREAATAEVARQAWSELGSDGAIAKDDDGIE